MSKANARSLAAKERTPWSASDLDTLRRFYAAGITNAKRIAKALRRSADSVSLKASRLGLGNMHRPKAVSRQPLLPLGKFPNKQDLRTHQSMLARARIAKNGHPRGALGMKHTAEVRANISAKSRAMWADPNSKLNSAEQSQRRSDELLKRIAEGQMRAKYTRCAGGKRRDLGDTYFRSAWEANYARFLNFRMRHGEILGWEYEPRTFVFEAIKRGTRAYTPDFKVWFPDTRYEWHEVKGWMDPKSKTRLARMAKYFPDEIVIVIGEEWFKQANRGIAYAIAGWERKGKQSPEIVHEPDEWEGIVP